jgi:hypothetical protein
MYGICNEELFVLVFWSGNIVKYQRYSIISWKMTIHNWFSIRLIDKTLTYIDSDIDNKLFSCLSIVHNISSAVKN